MKKNLVKLLSTTLLASLMTTAVSTSLANRNKSVVLNAASDKYDVQTLYEEGVKLDTELEEEGSVLFQNKDKALPLAKNTQVDVYGYVGYNIIQGGGGSGKGKWDSKCIFEKEAFELAGLDVNDELWNWMGSSNGANLVQESWVADNGGVLVNGNTYNLPEVPVETYRQSKSLAKPSTNTAVVTFGRQGHEGAELPMHMNSNYIDTNLSRKGSYDRTYLDPTETELELLKYLKEECGYKKIVVLINSSNVMTIGEYLQYSDACLWIGGPGEAGLIGVANVLKGEDSSGRQISPSGRTSDTWMTSFYSNPVFYNNGGGTNYSDVSGGGWGGTAKYNQYEEGIFVGYKWYETAYADKITVTGTDKKNYDFYNDYEDIVAMPFGGGLSYTDFAWEVVESDVKLAKGGTNTVKVKVTNTGDYAGKDVVQLYIHAPYNKGGIDKAEVSLCAFGKTGRLKPGESGILELSFKTDDVASYDYLGYKASENGVDNNGNAKWGGFVLEAGNYEVRVQSNSHVQKTDPISVTVDKDIIYTDNKDGKRDSDKQAAYNKINDVNATDGTGMIWMARDSIKEDWVTITNNGEGREDELYGDGTSGRAIGSEQSKAVNTAKQGETIVTYDVPYQNTTKKLTYHYGYQGATEFVGNTGTNYYGKANNDESYKKVVENIGKSTTTYTSKTRFDRTTNQVTTETDPAKSYGWDEVPFDDVRWDNWVDQGSLADFAKIQGTTYLGGYSSLGLEAGSAADGPGEAGTGNVANNTWWASEVVMASSWNTELVERVGQAYGRQSVRSGYTSCFGPAMNTHRSPFGGRNFEYYSEDGFLAGMMCVAETAGIQSEGVGTFNKHFMLNDLDGGRSGQIAYCNEQALREIYIRAWEYSMKSTVAPMSGMMASLNRIGITWANRGVYTGIIREEYGWNGLTISDGMDGVAYSGEVKATFSGVACLLWQNATDSESDAERNDGSIFSNYQTYEVADYYGVYQLRQIAKYRCYYDTHILCSETIFDGSDWTALESYNYETMPVDTLDANKAEEDITTGGCGGSIAASSALVATLSLATVGLACLKKKKED